MALVPLMYQVQSITIKRPNCKLQIEEKGFKGLVDTGADVRTHLQGIGYSINPKHILNLRFMKGY